jgi:hypothetical protein
MSNLPENIDEANPLYALLKRANKLGIPPLEWPSQEPYATLETLWSACDALFTEISWIKSINDKIPLMTPAERAAACDVILAELRDDASGMHSSAELIAKWLRELETELVAMRDRDRLRVIK